MDVEDSYEGAVRRMQRLQAARPELDGAAYPTSDASPFDDVPERIRELEELATLACEDNERLKRELAVAMNDLDGLRVALDATGREAESAYQENEQLRANVASLQQALASAQQAQAFAPASSASFGSQLGDDALADEELDYPPKQSKKPLLIIAAAVALVVGLLVLHPWENSRVAPPVVQPPPARVEPTPPPPTTITPPAAPSATATTPRLAPTIPKAAPLAAPSSRVTKSRAAHKRAKHNAANRHGSGAGAKAKSAAAAGFDDPLGGTNL